MKHLPLRIVVVAVALTLFVSGSAAASPEWPSASAQQAQPHHQAQARASEHGDVDSRTRYRAILISTHVASGLLSLGLTEATQNAAPLMLPLLTPAAVHGAHGNWGAAALSPVGTVGSIALGTAIGWAVSPDCEATLSDPFCIPPGVVAGFLVGNAVWIGFDSLVMTTLVEQPSDGSARVKAPARFAWGIAPAQHGAQATAAYRF